MRAKILEIVDNNVLLVEPNGDVYSTKKQINRMVEQLEQLFKAQTDKGGQAEVLVVPNERELTEYYNNEENQEWLNAPLGKQKASGAVAGQWQKEKPTKPCLFVHRYNEKDDKPGLQYAVMDCDVLCVTDIELNEFVSTMDEFADGEFFIIQFI